MAALFASMLRLPPWAGWRVGAVAEGLGLEPSIERGDYLRSSFGVGPQSWLGSHFEGG